MNEQKEQKIMDQKFKIGDRVWYAFFCGFPEEEFGDRRPFDYEYTFGYGVIVAVRRDAPREYERAWKPSHAGVWYEVEISGAGVNRPIVLSDSELFDSDVEAHSSLLDKIKTTKCGHDEKLTQRYLHAIKKAEKLLGLMEVGYRTTRCESDL